MSHAAIKIPDHSEGRNPGTTIDQEQRACYAIAKHFKELRDQKQLHEALDVWPNAAYQNYLNGN